VSGIFSSSRLRRALDISLSFTGLVGLSPLFLLIMIFGLLETGSPLFRQTRLGQNCQPFILVKFRTMRPDTPSVATHLADATAITRLGRFLRRTKLDELPQLWNVLRGEMSLVGPRPCLPEQHELISERLARRVFDRRPGITGYGQIAGVDMSDPVRLAEMDAALVADDSLKAYLWCLAMTVSGRGQGDRVRND
jgi:lipopolysaccharide/colanic/teichoic acid biosynthesis glycosyltransferase